MRNWTIGAAAAAMLLASTPAQAGWRGAEWGMTLQQVKAIQPKATPGDWFGRKALKTGPMDYADWTWESASYIFDKNGRLIEVSLNAEALSPEHVLPYLVAQFGAPVADADGTAVFRDDKRGNLVTLQDVGGDARLRFTPARIAVF